MFKKTSIIKNSLLILLVFLGASCAPKDNSKILQIGHFPNITHAQALIAHQMSIEGNGWFERYLGEDITIQWRIFNAGPSAMESLFTGSVDITYVGPNPAINAFVRTKGDDVRIIAGSADGGAALLVAENSDIKTPADFRGKKIATPQLGNTQDVICRAWLIKNGINVTLSGGDAQVIPTSNPDQLALLLTKNVDAVWTVEPWISRLEESAKAKVFLEQPDAVTTVLVSNVKTLKNRPELVEKLVQAHKDLTQWMIDNPQEAQEIVIRSLENITKSKISPELIKNSWNRIIFTSEINKKSINDFIDASLECSFVKERPDINKLIDAR